MEPNILKVALVQSDLHWEYPESNRMHFEALLSGMDRKVDLVCLPEMYSTGFSMNTASLAEHQDGPSVEWLRAMSAAHQCAICATVMITEGGRNYNRLLCFDQGNLITVYDKRHLFRMAGEHESYTPGADIKAFSFKGWSVLPRICYDLRFPVWSRNTEAHLQVYLANWPAPRISAWDKLLAARAIENQCYVIGVNRVGKDGNGNVYTGHSAVYDPRGERTTGDLTETEGIIYAQLNLNEVVDFRQKFPVGLDADHFSIDL